MASDQRTEKPTPRRLEKAREEGNFLSSRELVGAAQFAVFLGAMTAIGSGFLVLFREHFRATVSGAFRAAYGPAEVYVFYRDSLALFARLLAPLFLGLVLVPFLVHLGVTRMGFAPGRLKPDLKRLNPLAKLKDLPGQNLSSVAQALILLPLLLYAVYVVARPDWELFQQLPRMELQAALLVVASSVGTLLWKALGVFVFLGALDFVRQWRRHGRQLRMTKQEVREELKESEGNPLIKMQVRRLQRDMARRHMLKAVPQATAVITNPTHYAVAVRYEVETMAAPVVVAKGKNYLARRIREIAAAHNIAIVENPPLAQALYKSVDVGREIPVELYRAVAEVLAYIYRILHSGEPAYQRRQR
jgi:flagellar biosynthesis protein FlhB